MNDKISSIVLVRWVAVDDRQLRTLPFGDLRKARRRIDDERTPEDNEKVARGRLMLGPCHGDPRHRLAEGNGRRLHQSLAFAADRQLALLEKSLLDRLQLMALAAIEAARVGGIAVKLDDLRIGHT